ncbi:MAG: FAD-binding oxidoreductase [Elusimicrobia bacterium]|nr:FAD-binding oxidoreductase [Elusimicrobiota bacterium]
MPSELAAKDLSAILSPDSIIEDDSVRRQLTRDWWSQTLWWDAGKISEHAPSLVLRPNNEDELARVLAWANERGVIVVPRGGGSGVSGSAIPSNRDAVMLETLRLNKMTGLEGSGSQGEVTVGAGILGGELEAALNQKGWSLMHFPASLEISTVGGWIACGSYGQLSTLYGGIDAQTKKLRVALPGGSLKETPPDALMLSEGSLGVVTEATLKLRRLPKKHFFLSCEMNSASEGLDFVRSLIRQGLKPAVVRFYDPLEAKSAGLAYEKKPLFNEEARFKLRVFLLKHPTLVRWFRKSLSGKRWLLVMIFEDSQENVYRETARQIKAKQMSTSEKSAQVWIAKRSQWNTEKMTLLFNAGCFVDTLDTWGPWDKLPQIYAEVIRTASPYAIAMGHASHFTEQGGCLYFIFAGRGRSREESVRLHQKVWSSAMEAVIASGGLVNHHHGVGYAKLPWLRHAYAPGFFEGLKNRKKTFDPKGIMNPGKIL